MRTCERCPACRFKDEDGVWPVPGDGSKHADVAFLFEQPGKQENSMHRPMVGKTGDELENTYLPIAGLVRPDIWIDNTVRCKYADSGEAPPSDVVKVCSDFHARRAIEQINPRILVLSGGVANSLLKLDIDMVHGTGRHAKLWGWEGEVFSIYHPALGIHMGSKMQNLLDDFRTLRGFLHGEPDGYRRDEYPNPAYYRLRSKADVQSILDLEDGFSPIAIDTESSKTWKGYRNTIKYIPWCLTFCITPGEAFMIQVEDKSAIREFGLQVLKFRKILLHNATHDWGCLYEMGVVLDWRRITDTMSLSYHDARLARGLKPLSYALLGAEMRNFDDVVLPYGRKAVAEYLMASQEYEWPVPIQKPTGKFKLVKCKACKGTSVIVQGRGKSKTYSDCRVCDGGFILKEGMSRKKSIAEKIRMALNKYEADRSTDLIERWNGWMEDDPSQLQPIIEKLGPPPLPSVEMVPEEEILSYAGSDAHSTLRIAPLLNARLVALRRRFNGENL